MKLHQFKVFSLVFIGLFLIQSSVFAGDTLPRVIMETNMGSIVIEVDNKKAPISSKNFINYVKSGYFTGTIFHRVISNFMIQGGGFTESMNRKETGKPIKNEADNGLKNDKGTLAMARTGDPHSATAQFFINLVDNDFLNHRSKDSRGWGYAVFGKVIRGMDVVEKIGAVRTSYNRGMKDVPVRAIVIQKVVVSN